MEEYYTIESLLSFGGAVSATVLLPSVLLYLIGEKFKPAAKFVAMGVALFLALLGALLTTDTFWVKWVVAGFNGLVLFLAAVGVNVSGASIAQNSTSPAPVRTTRRNMERYELIQKRRRFWLFAFRPWL